MLYLIGGTVGRVAVFVDAGYLFAQGSVSLTENKVPRVNLSLAARSVVEEIRNLASETCSNCDLLRIYWYDGVITGTPISADQAAIADLDDTKLRLGFINSHGQQKGVDSLIVTDMIELARQKAISDAILLSGDEDVRIGVQIAQNYGVRVHLLGIHPARGSQSRTLRQEADTTHEWDAETVRKFLTVRSEPDVDEILECRTKAKPAPVKSSPVEPMGLDVSQELLIVVNGIVDALTEPDISSIESYWKSERGVPAEFDKKLLGVSRDKLGRNCERDEIRFLRATFSELVKKKK